MIKSAVTRKGWLDAPLVTLVALMGLVAVLALACGTAGTGDNGGDLDGSVGVVELINDEGVGHDDAAHDEAAIEDVKVEIAAVIHDEGVGHDDLTRIDDGEFFEVIVNVVEGRTLRYEPSIIAVPVGRRIKLTLVNDGRIEHDLEITGVSPDRVELAGMNTARGHEGVVAAHAMPATTATVLFTPTVAGEYGFACTIPGHKEAGMVGTLVVTPDPEA